MVGIGVRHVPESVIDMVRSTHPYTSGVSAERCGYVCLGLAAAALFCEGCVRWISSEAGGVACASRPGVDYLERFRLKNWGLPQAGAEPKP